MQISDLQGVKDISIHTVTISRNSDNQLNTFMFHCPYCAEKIQKVQGVIVKIAPGLEPTEDVTTINQCKNCKRNYTFQTQHSKAKKTRVVLTIFTHLNVFYCCSCRLSLLGYGEDRIIRLVDQQDVNIPVNIDCPQCNHQFVIADIVQKSV